MTAGERRGEGEREGREGEEEEEGGSLEGSKVPRPRLPFHPFLRVRTRRKGSSLLFRMSLSGFSSLFRIYSYQKGGKTANETRWKRSILQLSFEEAADARVDFKPHRADLLSVSSLPLTSHFSLPFIHLPALFLHFHICFVLSPSPKSAALHDSRSNASPSSIFPPSPSGVGSRDLRKLVMERVSFHSCDSRSL